MRFSLFLISAHSENLIYLALVVKKFKILAAPFEETPILVSLNFVKFYLFFIFADPELRKQALLAKANGKKTSWAI